MSFSLESPMTTTVKVETEYEKAKTSVWWDIENCEVPKGWDALLKMNYGGPLSISAYGDTNLIPHNVQQALSSTGVHLNHVPSGVKDASNKKILVDMMLWVIDNPAPANFMLISGDRDFSYALHQLRMRRYNILLAQPPRASVPLVAAANNVWLWTSLASGGPPLTNVESSRLISNKPTIPASEVGGTMDHKTGLPQETWKNILLNGRGATSESITSNRSNASQKTQASVSAKPIQEAKLVEPVWCQVCQCMCANKDTFAVHTYGKRHRKNLELQPGMSKNVGPVEVPKEILKKLKMREVSQGRANRIPDRFCGLCKVVCQSHDFDIHLRSKKHADMLSLSQSKALIDSKNLEEKVVRESDQGRETIAGIVKPLNLSKGATEVLKEVEKKEVMATFVDSCVAESSVSTDLCKEIDKLVSQDQTILDSHTTSQNHADMIKEQALEKIDSVGFEETQGNNGGLKERFAISKSSVHAFVELKSEYLIHKESRGCLVVLPERVEVGN